MNNIPTITKNLLIINVLVFLAAYVLGIRGIDLNGLLGLHFFPASHFGIYQLFTYLFMHGGWAHLFFNMFALWMFGCVVENAWGPKKFLFYYIACGVGAGLLQEVAQFVQFYVLISDQYADVSFSDVFHIAQSMSSQLNGWTTVGASGAVYGILLAFGMIYPEQRIFVFPLPIPIKAKWFVMIYAGIELFSALGTSSDGVAHFAHLGGMLFGYFMIKYWQKHPNGGTGAGRYSSRGETFDKLKDFWERHQHTSNRTDGQHRPDERTSDWEYNARKKAEEEETDRILDKIKRSGYDSLTAEEKEKLFNAGNRK